MLSLQGVMVMAFSGLRCTHPSNSTDTNEKANILKTNPNVTRVLDARSPSFTPNLRPKASKPETLNPNTSRRAG